MAAVIDRAQPVTFIDHLAGPDRRYTVRLSGCPGCGGRHAVALAPLTGRFMYRCGRTECSGEIDGWTETRRRWESQAPDAPNECSSNP